MKTLTTIISAILLFAPTLSYASSACEATCMIVTPSMKSAKGDWLVNEIIGKVKVDGVRPSKAFSKLQNACYQLIQKHPKYSPFTHMLLVNEYKTESASHGKLKENIKSHYLASYKKATSASNCTESYTVLYQGGYVPDETELEDTSGTMAIAQSNEDSEAETGLEGATPNEYVAGTDEAAADNTLNHFSSLTDDLGTGDSIFDSSLPGDYLFDN